MNKKRTMLQRMGGRKAMAFYATLLALFILAIMNKAHAEIISAIDSLFLIFAGANVAKGRQDQAPKETKKEKTHES